MRFFFLLLELHVPIAEWGSLFFLWLIGAFCYACACVFNRVSWQIMANFSDLDLFLVHSSVHDISVGTKVSDFLFIFSFMHLFSFPFCHFIDWNRMKTIVLCLTTGMFLGKYLTSSDCTLGTVLVVMGLFVCLVSGYSKFCVWRFYDL